MKQIIFLLMFLSCTPQISIVLAAPSTKNLSTPVSVETAKVLLGEVKAGTRKEANASWWGFDKEDATACLQTAIDSGVPKLIVDNTGSNWIINRTIQLVSNQEIVFADGVVVKAKKGHFKAIGDSLFRGSGLQKIILRGKGKAILQMNKEDYQDPTQYKLGEWRHGINLGGCTDVVIQNLTIKETGGDGIYIGAGTQPYCENVLIEDVILDGNNRLGMAVISAQNLTVRRCQFINASGASPQGGIDFEPNKANERLVNCMVEDSIFSNNVKGAGASVSPNHLNSESLPVSVTFKNCVFNDNALGLFLYPTRRSATDPAIGDVHFIDCQLKGNTSSAALFQDPVATSVKINFKNCQIDNTASKGEALRIVCKEAKGRAIGNIFFDNTTVIQKNELDPIAIKYQGNGDVSNEILGTLQVQRAGQTTPFDLLAFTKQEQAKFQKINAQRPATIQLDQLVAPATDAAREDNSEVYLRGKFTFIQFAQAGQNITITAHSITAGYAEEPKLELRSPDDQLLKTYTIKSDGQPYPITFTATTTGFYRVVGRSVNRVDLTSPHQGNGILIDGYQTFLPIKGRLYFEVPAGVKEFSMGVAADAGADITLLDPNDKEIMKRENIDSMELFSATRNDATRSEIWSIALSKVIWHVTVRPYEPLIPIVSTNRATLLLANK